MESTRKQKKEPPNEPTYTELSVLPLDPAQTFLLQASSLTRFQRSINFVDFLLSMNKNRYTCERIFDACDITFYWYRTFVMCADYANFIPQFRELSKEDQVPIKKASHGTLQ
uniref:Uncharacterized protein n=1 Tax=Acrobeloides nanus TaxID=290746 RepID=A0A914EK55_9BILA